MYPMRCTPFSKVQSGAGNRLRTMLNKAYDPPSMAESWELSCHKDGYSGIANGPFAGQRLADVIEKYPHFVGQSGGGAFPLLVKFIDARTDLSIQVHPSQEKANLQNGEESKTEIWVTLHCQPGAIIYYGFNRTVSAEELVRRAHDGSICEVLNRVPVRMGDVFHIHAGTVHAIGAGLLMAEIQQNANTTFRVFDYMRKDASGQTRPLHVEDAARVADLTAMEGKPAPVRMVEDNAAYRREMLFDSPLFTTERIAIRSGGRLCRDETSFDALLFADGEALIRQGAHTFPARRGDCYFMPAGMGAYQIEGSCSLLRSRVPAGEEGPMMQTSAVIMAGGKGERFWPMSRAQKPKQFLPLLEENRTMIQQTVDRILPLVRMENVLVATGKAVF